VTQEGLGTHQVPKGVPRVPYAGIVGAGLGAGLGASLCPQSPGSAACQILVVVGAFVGYFAGRALGALIRGQWILPQGEINHRNRAVFAVAEVLCLAAMVASVRWFAHSGTPDALSTAALTASLAVSAAPVICVPILDIRTASRVSAIVNVPFAAISLYALTEKPSALSIVGDLWCNYVAARLIVAHFKGARNRRRS